MRCHSSSCTIGDAIKFSIGAGELLNVHAPGWNHVLALKLVYRCSGMANHGLVNLFGIVSLFQISLAFLNTQAAATLL